MLKLLTIITHFLKYFHLVIVYLESGGIIEYFVGFINVHQNRM